MNFFLYFTQHVPVGRKINAEPSDSKASLSATNYILDAVPISTVPISDLNENATLPKTIECTTVKLVATSNKTATCFKPW